MRLWQRQIGTWAAVLLPVLGLSGLVAKAELAVRSGPSFRIPISGFDPRDPIHGRFLRYQYDFDWRGGDSCHGPVSVSGEVEIAARELQRPGPQYGCCLCLTRSRADGFNPSVRQVDCEESKSSCDGWLRASEMMPPQRYFVPEDRALELEQALTNTRASIEVVVSPNGSPAIKELYLGDRPWREARGLDATARH